MRPTLGDKWDLGPWDDDPDSVDAHYIRESSEPEIDDEGREIWLYVSAHAVGTMTRRVVPGIVLTSAHAEAWGPYDRALGMSVRSRREARVKVGSLVRLIR